MTLMANPVDLLSDAAWAKVPKQKPICFPALEDADEAAERRDIELMFQEESQRGAGVVRVLGGYRQKHIAAVLK